MMRFISHIHKACALLFFVIVMLNPPGCATHNNFVAQGREYAASGNWDKSAQAFQQAYDKNPNDKEIELLLFRAKKNASLAHLARGEAFLRNHQLDEAISEFQMSIVFDATNIEAESLIEKAMAVKESNYHLKKGENLLKAQKDTQAKEAFQTALNLNPDNAEARKALALIQKKEQNLPKYGLNIQNKDPISLKFKNTPILNVFEVLTRLTGINFIFDKDVQETKVTFFLTDVQFDEFIDIFLQTNKLTGKLVNEKTMIIYPDTLQKAKEYDDLQIRTFYLANMDVKKAVTLLSKIFKGKEISANEESNAVVIRGTKGEIEIAAKLIEANDRPTSEVMFNVEILEVSRSKERQIGLEIDPTTATIGIGEATSGYFNAGAEDAPAMGSFSLNVVDKISKENILVSIPSATINLLKRDGDTKTLASPQIRVKNKEKAKIHIGERIPLRSNRRVDTTGAITYDYQYQDVGIKLNVEPIINLHDDISLKLTLEVSSIGENVGTTDDPQYSIRTRTAESVMSLRSGESVIIGGLISDEERRTIRKIPLLGDVPILGYLFSNYDTTDAQTDILMAITPIIIREQEIPSSEVTQIWSGKDQNFYLREPYFGYYEQEETAPSKQSHKPVGESEARSMPAPAPGSPPIPKNRPIPSEPASTGPDIQTPPSVVANEIKPPLNLEPEGSIQSEKAIPDHTTLTRTETSKPINNTLPASKPAAPSPVGSSPDIKADLWPPSLKYSVHVNSFVEKLDADRRVQELKQMSYDSFALTGRVEGETQIYYRVFIGKFEDFKAAEKFCEDLKQKRGFRDDIHVVNRSWALGG
ncbi:MAG: tetratricopeptide repeat protein [Deltaproteobacteria bacterium]|nr:tetratricopeptide repeat protein [Deltaproteobacteria bacterium]